MKWILRLISLWYFDNTLLIHDFLCPHTLIAFKWCNFCLLQFREFLPSHHVQQLHATSLYVVCQSLTELLTSQNQTPSISPKVSLVTKRAADSIQLVTHHTIIPVFSSCGFKLFFWIADKHYVRSRDLGPLLQKRETELKISQDK